MHKVKCTLPPHPLSRPTLSTHPFLLSSQGFMGSRSCELEFRLDLRTYVVWIGRLDEPSVDPAPPPVDKAPPPVPSSVPNNNSNGINEPISTAIIDNTDNPSSTTSLPSSSSLPPSSPPPLPPPSLGSHAQITIAITYTNRVFDDNAFGLRDVLQSVTHLPPPNVKYIPSISPYSYN